MKKKYQIERPNVISYDDLANMQDEVLVSRKNYLNINLSKAELDDLVKEIQTEIAYIDRELEIRNIRSAKHNEYINNQIIIDEPEYIDENEFPNADIDNSAFIF